MLAVVLVILIVCHQKSFWEGRCLQRLPRDQWPAVCQAGVEECAATSLEKVPGRPGGRGSCCLKPSCQTPLTVGVPTLCGLTPARPCRDYSPGGSSGFQPRFLTGEASAPREPARTCGSAMSAWAPTWPPSFGWGGSRHPSFGSSRMS